MPTSEVPLVAAAKDAGSSKDAVTDRWLLRQIFRIGTVRYAEGL